MKFLHYHLVDLQNIFKKPAAISTLIALIILPGFYAWFNIISSWNPYENTKAIKIAVANADVGTNFLDKNINIGNSLVANLQENTSLGWNFVTPEEAEQGVTEGTYYASILIEKDFSKNLVSFMSEHPTKPKLIYTVNQKINAIAPNITKK